MIGVGEPLLWVSTAVCEVLAAALAGCGPRNGAATMPATARAAPIAPAGAEGLAGVESVRVPAPGEADRRCRAATGPGRFRPHPPARKPWIRARVRAIRPGPRARERCRRVAGCCSNAARCRKPIRHPNRLPDAPRCWRGAMRRLRSSVRSKRRCATFRECAATASPSSGSRGGGAALHYDSSAASWGRRARLEGTSGGGQSCWGCQRFAAAAAW